MNTKHCPLLVALATLLTVLALSPLHGAAPRLRFPIVLSNRTVELTLSADAGVAYSVEASLNLSNWFVVSTGVASNGLLTLRHDAATNYPTLFYRAKGPDDSLPPLTVGVGKDTNLSGTTLVSIDGVSTVLYARDGTRFTLNLPSNSIPDARALTMTLVSNFTALPFARGTLGAVLLEPADIKFWGAATLEITFPTNVDRREIVSFFCHADGSLFQLTPDRVYADRIVIPVTRAGVFGSSLATTQELEHAALISTESEQLLGLALAGKSAVAKDGGAADCFPEKEAIANAVDRQITSAYQTRSRQLAAMVSRARRNQSADSTDDSSSVVETLAAELCVFYAAHIAPRWAQAANNCPLGKVLMQHHNVIERQRALLGATPCASTPPPFCAIVNSCLDDIRQCCAQGRKGSAKVSAVRSLQRADALLGTGCIDANEAQEVIDLCSSNVWTGRFTATQTGAETRTGGGGSIVEVDEYNSKFEGDIVEALTFGTPETGMTVLLRVTGTFAGRILQSVHSRAGPIPCGPDVTLSSLSILSRGERVSAVESSYQITLTTQPGGSYTMFGLMAHSSTESFPPANLTALTHEHRVWCDGPDTFINQTDNRIVDFPGAMLTVFNETTSNSTVFSGSVGAPIEYPETRFTWNFFRRAGP